MAIATLGKLVRLRRLTSADLLANEATVLRNGEPAYVAETGEIRVGDGTNGFINLPTGRSTRVVRTVTASHVITRGDDVIISNAGGATTVTLPSAALNPGRAYVIKNRGAGTVTVAATAGTVEAGATSIATGAITQAGAVNYFRYVSDGTNWYVA
jgi:hypothetical protein